MAYNLHPCLEQVQNKLRICKQPDCSWGTFITQHSCELGQAPCASEGAQRIHSGLHMFSIQWWTLGNQEACSRVTPPRYPQKTGEIMFLGYMHGYRHLIHLRIRSLVYGTASAEIYPVTFCFDFASGFGVHSTCGTIFEKLLLRDCLWII